MMAVHLKPCNTELYMQRTSDLSFSRICQSSLITIHQTSVKFSALFVKDFDSCFFIFEQFYFY